jgi:chromosome segregation protein
MYLSKLDLFGFKSFAQRINVKFDSGMTAIVGPNGCGKTNIVDAIRWVLGEQKTSVLRSDKMENVIFNGTRQRKPLGMSEVSLTIENTKNILPTEYTEVTITRRLYRNGDSEYLLNKVPCRLKDIHDLFTDTGMGSDAYSVIELKMIEQILSENNDERRKLFEEAAGITKYKQRRKQTFKKLETTAQDLSRVQDIVLEVEKKVVSLERQAKKAEQAREIKRELKTLEILLAERLIADLRAQITPLKEKIAKNDAEKIELTAKIDALDAALEKRRLEMIDVEKNLSMLQRELNAKSELVNATEKQIVSNTERKKLLSENIVRAKEQVELAERRAADLDDSRQTLTEDLKQKEELVLLAKRLFKAESEKQQQLESERRTKREALEQTRRESAQLTDEANRLGLQAESLKTRIENFNAQIERGETRKRDISQLLTDRAAASDHAQIKMRELQQTLSTAQSELTSAKSQRESLSEKISALKEELLVTKSQENEKKSRAGFLQSLLESYEGLPEGVKALDAVEAKPYGFGVLSDLISTDEKYRVAIAAALGEAATYYVAPTRDAALAGAQTLRNLDKGKLTFLVLEKLSELNAAQTVTDTLFVSKPESTAAVRALDVITCDDAVRPAVEYLCSRVFIAESGAQAEELSRTYPQQIFVTPEGERFSESTIRGGSMKENDGLRIGKRDELQKLDADQLTLREKITSLESELDQTADTMSRIILAEFEQATRRIEQDLMNEDKRLTQLAFERNAFESELKTIDERAQFDKAELQKITDDFQRIAPTLDEVEQKQTALAAALAQNEAALNGVEMSLQTVSASARQKEIEQKDAEFDVQRVQDRLRGTENEQKNVSTQLMRLTDEIDGAEEETFRLSSELETMNSNLQSLFTQKAEQEKSIGIVEGDYSRLKSDVVQEESSLRDFNRQREVISQMVMEFQQQLTQAELKEDHTRTVINTEYGIELDVKTFDEAEVFSRPESEEKVTEFKNKLRSLGPVNELALEEFDEEKKRLEFLTTQRNDLVDSEKQLRETIEEINKTANELFQKTFEQIRQNFIGIFRELFNEGDEADLVLEASEDPLEGNIDIIAKPKGKRPQAITLLSGGEKTLTATALLFAIYLVKPSPFCILDEVDAPLDDANVDRFVKLIDKFATDTQFIVVTHNKRTMEACRMLYGITMEEEGVSKLVAVKFDKVSQN